MINEHKNREVEKVSDRLSVEESSTRGKELAQFKSVAFFLERTAESIKRTTAMVQELESEVARLRYELMATENEYKNLQHMNQDLEMRLMGGSDATAPGSVDGE